MKNKLHYKEYGEGEPLVILHGLFGMLDNWKSFARAISEEYRVILVDQRNHGRSFHHDEMNYRVMAEDLKHLMDALSLDQAIVLGHSMGGKTAMEFAKTYPASVKKLIVVDIGPQAYPAGHGFIFDALKSISVDQLESRSDAQKQLAEGVEDKGIQLFLLKNLKRNSDGSYSWRMNLSAIEAHYEEILSGIEIDTPIEPPTLFINGTQSKYIRSRDEYQIRNKFTQVEFQKIDAGHWVHAEAPEAFYHIVKEYLAKSISKME